MEKFEKLSILIPVYNEGRTIHKILDRIDAVQLVNNIKKEIILVNDCSTDNTEEALRNYMAAHPHMDMHYFAHEKNQGKGAAVHTAIPKATGDYTIIQDADLEYDPEEYNLLIKPVIRGDADVVYGSRFLGGNAHRILFFWHSIGNKFLTFMTNMFTNLNLTDVHTCYKLIKTSTLQSIRLKEKRFAIDPELKEKKSTGKMGSVRCIRS
jgi:glycosyltransferase involved in cell wall biosynthesis